jgi:hypothetical protein
MIGHCAGVAWRAFHHIKAVHRRLVAVRAAALDEVARPAHVVRLFHQEVGVQRQNHVRAVETILRQRVAPEGGNRTGACVVALIGSHCTHSASGKTRRKSSICAPSVGDVHGFAEYSQAGAAPTALGL